MDISKSKDKKEIKKFTVYLSIFLFLIGSIQIFLEKNTFFYFYFIGLFTLFVGFFLPTIIKPVFIILNYISSYLGKINSKVLLTLFFYFFITPIGFLLKLTKKDILNLEIKKEIKSYWIKRTDFEFQKEDFKNQF